jgi:hypothetical protein
VRVWDLRTPGCQREYGSRAAVNTVVLHPNQGELISGAGPPPGPVGAAARGARWPGCAVPARHPSRPLPPPRSLPPSRRL